MFKLKLIIIIQTENQRSFARRRKTMNFLRLKSTKKYVKFFLHQYPTNTNENAVNEY